MNEKSDPPDSFFTGVHAGVASGSQLSFFCVAPLALSVVGLTLLGRPRPLPRPRWRGGGGGGFSRTSLLPDLLLRTVGSVEIFVSRLSPSPSLGAMFIL